MLVLFNEIVVITLFKAAETGNILQGKNIKTIFIRIRRKLFFVYVDTLWEIFTLSTCKWNDRNGN
jgi:hypothetical protein